MFSGQRFAILAMFWSQTSPSSQIKKNSWVEKAADSESSSIYWDFAIWAREYSIENAWLFYILLSSCTLKKNLFSYTKLAENRPSSCTLKINWKELDLFDCFSWPNVEYSVTLWRIWQFWHLPDISDIWLTVAGGFHQVVTVGKLG